MRILDGALVLSASDLTGFAACEHLRTLDLAVARGERARPERHDPFVEVLARRGEHHERDLLEERLAAGSHVVEIAPDTTSRAGLEAATAETIDAMRAGAAVIFQATFFHDGWVGHADFVERIDVPSALGDWSYEVADAKLARSVKAGAILQLCSYSEHVARIQGREPEHLHILQGDTRRTTLRLADYAAYYRRLKQRFLEALDSHEDTYPEPVQHCTVCRWAEECADRRRDDDHLSLVAGIRRDQRRKLADAGIETRGALGRLDAPPRVEGIGAPTLAALHHQARLQVAGEGHETPLHELLEPRFPDGEDGDGPHLGLAAMPAPSPGDLFLDLEGDPFVEGTGIEYLFGVVEVVGSTPRFQRFWAHDRHEERLAFEALVDLIVERRARHPDLHVYHYAPYETTALKRLMGLHATRESELDDLLRHEVFVDLLQVVRHAVRLSTESYGLKDVERLYMHRGGDAVLDAGESIVAYEEYLETGDRSILEGIEVYNRDDCESLVGLRDWLEARRVEAEARWGPIPRRPEPDGEASEELVEDLDRRAELAARLCADVPDDPGDRDDDQQARFVLAHLLDWHRREDKPAYWRYYQRARTYNDDDFVEDPDCIGGLVYEGEVGRVKQSIVHRYRFEPQDHKFSTDDQPHDPRTEKSAGTVVAVGDDHVDLKRGATSPVPHPEALIPFEIIRTDVLQTAIEDVARGVLQDGIDGPGPHRAGRELLRRRPPRIEGVAPGGRIARPGEPLLEVATGVVGRLDRTCLPIQGPPGAGKTYTGAHMIVTLLASGARVGVTSNSHAVITNLLDAVCTHADERDVEFDCIQKPGNDPEKACTHPRVEVAGTNGEVADALRSSPTLAAGTAWLWSRGELRDSVDVLVVDEAGQMSLANVVAVSTAAASVVLLGDPQQLAQPSKGSHPDGVGVSALEHLLGAQETIPDERGIFLDASYRMHPEVARFISTIAYEGRLHSAPGRELQAVDGFAGLRFHPVDHVGNRVRAPEEARAVAELVDELVGASWIDEEGAPRGLTLSDLIVIAPYNAQVAELRAQLPEGARVGTVDRFQGQEGVVALYSMASSSSEEAPRGMRFLYDLHRLNVAISRARAVGIVVASPELVRAACRSAEEMRLANALCHFVEVAR